MTYKDRFVAEIKCGGKILRVKDDTVYLPFKSEYSLLLKNLNTQRASLNIDIDGQDVLDGHSLIIGANETSELMGFLKGATARNRFRFIQKTKQIQEHRGDKIEDGVVRVEFAFERPSKEPWITKTIDEVHHHHHYNPPFRYDHYGSDADWTYSNSGDSGDSGDDRDVIRGRGIASFGEPVSSYNCSVENLGVTPAQDEGITVKGSQINQAFNYASMGPLEDSKVIIIKLCGLTESGVKIKSSLSVKNKITCPTCGKKSKSSAKFCSGCATFLE